jgi:cytochrome c556
MPTFKEEIQMKKTLFSAVLALVLGAGYTLTAFAQAKPDVLVKQRQSAMTLIGKYFGPLGGMAAGRVPFDATVVARNAGYLDTLVKLPWDGFDPSTADIKSAALPEVYKDAAKFKSAQDMLQGEIPKLVTAAKGGNEATVKAAIGAVGKACGNCHDNFRQKQ